MAARRSARSLARSGWRRCGPRWSGSPRIRLPGSGGAADIACLAQRLVVIMAHERRRLRARVDYITSPGFGSGPGWREQVGLPRGGPAALITTLGVFRFDPATGQA